MTTPTTFVSIDGGKSQLRLLVVSDARRECGVGPGMTYQPPLIGTKTLLNMTSTSLPWTGSLFIGASFLLGCLALYFDTRKLQSLEV
jgi:hypothetical protein